MKRTSAELKTMARSALTGNFGNFAVCYLLYILITWLVQSLVPGVSITQSSSLSSISISLLISLILSLLLNVLEAGFIKISLSVSRKEGINVKDLFFALRNHPDRYLILYLIFMFAIFLFEIPGILCICLLAGELIPTNAITLFITGLICLLMLVLAIIFLLKYALASIILTEDTEISSTDAMKASKQIMEGNKSRYFYLLVSFIGFKILSLLSLGIANFWVDPYIKVTKMEFYRDVTGELELPNEI